MTGKIDVLKQFQWEKKHHAYRQPFEAGSEIAWRNASLSDSMRTALRLKCALDAETPVLLPDEIIAFTRTVENFPRQFSEKEWAEICAHHAIHEHGNISNLSPDYEAVMRSGLLAIRERLSDSDEHNAMRISIDAVLDLTKRYAALARSSGDAVLAEVLERVPAYAPRTFREALQCLRILHFAMWAEGDYHNTLGRFDQYMIPYLEHDMKNGIETEESAFELLEAFFLSCNRDSDLYPGMQQGDNGQSIVLGGMTPDGQNGYNCLSEMCLRASAELRLIDPKINLRVNKDTPLSVYELGTRLTRIGLGFPQYENDDVAIPALMDWDYEERDARDYAVAACWEFIIPGKGMEVVNIEAMPLANVVDHAIRTSLGRSANIDALKAQIAAEINAKVDAILESKKNLYFISSPFLSLFFEGCVEHSRDIAQGCKYNNWGIHGTGLAPAADMLAAIEQVVFREKTPTEEVIHALENNFVGYDKFRERLLNAPKMGNDDDRVDDYAVWLLDTFADAVKGKKNDRGGIVRAGTGTAMYYVSHAAELGATADGREEGVPLPANYAPSLNVRLNGPVSLIKSFTKPHLGRVLNGGPLTVEFSDSVFAQDEAIKKVAQLVRLFILRGGHEIQLNTVNRDRLLDAQKHPENYRNLIVRVWGWSGYFVELDKCYQEHIIRRAELNL